jgi:hypothetical protein
VSVLDGIPTRFETSCAMRAQSHWPTQSPDVSTDTSLSGFPERLSSTLTSIKRLCAWHEYRAGMQRNGTPREGLGFDPGTSERLSHSRMTAIAPFFFECRLLAENGRDSDPNMSHEVLGWKPAYDGRLYSVRRSSHRERCLGA